MWWWKTMKADCTKGYTEEICLGEGEIYKAHAKAVYLCLPRAIMWYKDKLTDTVTKYIYYFNCWQHDEIVVRGGYCWPAKTQAWPIAALFAKAIITDFYY